MHPHLVPLALPCALSGPGRAGFTTVHRPIQDLPHGLLPQLAWHKDIGSKCVEFDRVYDRLGRLDHRRSFWVITALDVDPRASATAPEFHSISYGEYRDAFGKQALPFRSFSSAVVGPAEIELWIDVRSQYLQQQ